MAVTQGFIYKAFPGKQPAMMARMNASKALIEKHGLEVRVLVNVAGAATANTVMLTMSCDDMATWGQKFQEVSEDPEFQKMQAAIAESPNGEMISSAIWMDAPG